MRSACRSVSCSASRATSSRVALTVSTNQLAIDADTTPRRAIPPKHQRPGDDPASTLTGYRSPYPTVVIVVTPPQRVTERGDRGIALGVEHGARSDEPDERDAARDVDEDAAAEPQLEPGAGRDPHEVVQPEDRFQPSTRGLSADGGSVPGSVGPPQN